jgi:poly(A) polymerase
LKSKLNQKWIDHRALGIVKKLQKEGFETYLVGGCVRDLLLGLEPKDFDIATTARPRQVKKLIRNTFIIGRRFRLVLAKEGEDQFEISTFRRNPTAEEQNDPEISDDNLFGTSEQDAQRRDFTINSLFYDPVAEKVIDHTGDGVPDLKNRIIRMIGDPTIRLAEDPIRILRAIRFAHKTNCELTFDLKLAVSEFASTLKTTALPRRREEILKFLRLKSPEAVLYQLYDLGILDHLAPGLNQIFKTPEAGSFLRQILSKLNNQARQNCEPYELFSILVLPMVFSQFKPDDAKTWFENEKNLNILKNELGMFNTEIHVLNQGLKYLSQVFEFEKYLEFRERQKIDFLNQKSFAEALNIAFLCDLISLSEISQWSREFINYPQQNAEIVDNKRHTQAGKKKKLEPKRK